ncbi:MAG: hypothetical protein WD990_03065 [Acidimicrobiia bacterium]
MKDIILGSAAALAVALMAAGGYAVAQMNGPGSDAEWTVSTNAVVGVPYGATDSDTRQGLRPHLQAGQATDWAEAPHLEACGFSQELLIAWDQFEATFARNSSSESGILVAASSFRSDIAAPSGVTVGQTIDEVQQLGGFLAYVDGPITGEGTETAAIAPIGVDIVQLAQFEDGVVDAIFTGIPCIFGVEPPTIPNITTTTSTTSTSTTITTTRPTTTTTRAPTTTRRTTTTTRPVFPEWEVGWCVAELAGLVEPVDCASPRADYRIFAVVNTQSRCPQATEYYVDLDDGTVACFG